MTCCPGDKVSLYSLCEVEDQATFHCIFLLFTNFVSFKSKLLKWKSCHHSMKSTNVGSPLWRCYDFLTQLFQTNYFYFGCLHHFTFHKQNNQELPGLKIISLPDSKSQLWIVFDATYSRKSWSSSSSFDDPLTLTLDLNSPHNGIQVGSYRRLIGLVHIGLLELVVGQHTFWKVVMMLSPLTAQWVIQASWAF